MSEDRCIDTWRAVHLLRRLGIPPKIAGFQYAVYGISIGIKDDRRCLSVMNWIYPEIARHYQVSAGAVESGIRSMLAKVWKENPTGFDRMFGCKCAERLTSGDFIILAVYYLKSH